MGQRPFQLLRPRCCFRGIAGGGSIEYQMYGSQIPHGSEEEFASFIESWTHSPRHANGPPMQMPPPPPEKRNMAPLADGPRVPKEETSPPVQIF